MNNNRVYKMVSRGFTTLVDLDGGDAQLAIQITCSRDRHIAIGIHRTACDGGIPGSLGVVELLNVLAGKWPVENVGHLIAPVLLKDGLSGKDVFKVMRHIIAHHKLTQLVPLAVKQEMEVLL